MSSTNPSVQAGRLRHLVDIEKPITGTDSAGGPVVTWSQLYQRVPAAIESLSGREYFAARQVQSDVTTEILIRWRPHITSACRVVRYHPASDSSPPPCEIYNIEAALPDATGRRYLTLLCKVRAEEGFRTDGE